MSDDPNENPAEKPDAFAEPADWLTELRELYPEWKPPNAYDPEEMRAAYDAWWNDYIEINDEQDRQVFTLSGELKRFLVLTEALAKSAVANDLGSAPLITFLEDARSFYFGLQDRLPIAGEHVRVLLEQLKFKLEAQQHTSPSQAVPSPATPQLPPEPPLILDQEKKKRTNRPEIDQSRFTMRWKGKSYQFKNTRIFWVMVYLAERFGELVPVNDLIDEVWQDSRTEFNTVHRTISNRRRHLESLGVADLAIDGSNQGHYRLHER